MSPLHEKQTDVHTDIPEVKHRLYQVWLFIQHQDIVVLPITFQSR